MRSGSESGSKSRRKNVRTFQVSKSDAWSAALEETACAVLRVRKQTLVQSKSEAEKKWKRKLKQNQSKSGSECTNISGDNSLRDPPVPIPNTEVKPQHADSTWLETAR